VITQRSHALRAAGEAVDQKRGHRPAARRDAERELLGSFENLERVQQFSFR
jgi:hypothetical protein